MSESGSAGLRGKYLDWCSARVAERFLDLTPEEIYELARPSEGSGGPHPSQPITPLDESYRALVQRATDALLGRMSLPTFEQWSRAYAEDPSRFDAEMLGFWVEASGESE